MAELDFSDPIYKKLSRRNGEINKLTKAQLVKTLIQLGLDTKGQKPILQKRLKTYHRQQLLADNKPGGKKTQDINFLLVIDFEATCESNPSSMFLHEIIEFPIVLVDVRKKEVVSEFHSYVRPQFNPTLSEFCKRLTGITQKQVHDARLFPEVLAEAQAWIDSHQLGQPGRTAAVMTDSQWDMSKFMTNQCHASELEVPSWAWQWVEVKRAYSTFYGGQKLKIKDMLEGIGLAFDGQLHSGIDDAKNIARIALRLIEDGCVLRVNERMELVSGGEQPVYMVHTLPADLSRRYLHRFNKQKEEEEDTEERKEGTEAEDKDEEKDKAQITDKDSKETVNTSPHTTSQPKKNSPKPEKVDTKKPLSYAEKCAKNPSASDLRDKTQEGDGVNQGQGQDGVKQVTDMLEGVAIASVAAAGTQRTSKHVHFSEHPVVPAAGVDTGEEARREEEEEDAGREEEDDEWTVVTGKNGK